MGPACWRRRRRGQRATHAWRLERMHVAVLEGISALAALVSTHHVVVDGVRLLLGHCGGLAALGRRCLLHGRGCHRHDPAGGRSPRSPPGDARRTQGSRARAGGAAAQRRRRQPARECRCRSRRHLASRRRYQAVLDGTNELATTGETAGVGSAKLPAAKLGPQCDKLGRHAGPLRQSAPFIESHIDR